MPDELFADAGDCSERNLQTLEGRAIRGYLATGHRKRGDGQPPCGHNTPLATGGRRNRYRLRKITIKPVFGQIQQARGFRQFLPRGIEQARQEWALVCIAHNLNKLTAAQA